MAYSIEYLQDNKMLCDYCKWTDRGTEDRPKVACYGGEPVMCEGSLCDEAYEYYLDNYACDTDIDDED